MRLFLSRFCYEAESASIYVLIMFYSQQTILKSRKTTDPVRTERENLPPKTQPGISLNLKVCKCLYSALRNEIKYVKNM